jgi:hypothetical protein
MVRKGEHFHSSLYFHSYHDSVPGVARRIATRNQKPVSEHCILAVPDGVGMDYLMILERIDLWKATGSIIPKN